MLIKIKNKAYLTVDDFKFRCSIGKNKTRSKKKEGDNSTPKGIFSIGKLYYRKDRVKKPISKIKTRIITENMGWCDDPENKSYNKEIKIPSKINHEKLFKKDNSYDYFIVINYNIQKIKPYKGSAIFLHLTKNYKPTAGCIAVKKKDFIIISKIVDGKTKIRIL